MKHFKTFAIVPTLAVALAGLLTTNVASAEWYKLFGEQAYTTKDTRDTRRDGTEKFAQSRTVTTDALNVDQEKHRSFRQMEHEITKNLPGR